MQLRESDGAGRANPEDDAQRKQQKPEVRDTRTQAASPLHTPHTDKCFKQINGRRRQAQNAGAECMKRVSRLTRGAEGPPRGRVQGLTTPMPRPSSGWMQHKRQDTKTLHASADAATRSVHMLDAPEEAQGPTLSSGSDVAKTSWTQPALAFSARNSREYSRRARD